MARSVDRRLVVWWASKIVSVVLLGIISSRKQFPLRLNNFETITMGRQHGLIYNKIQAFLIIESA